MTNTYIYQHFPICLSIKPAFEINCKLNFPLHTFSLSTRTNLINYCSILVYVKVVLLYKL